MANWIQKTFHTDKWWGKTIFIVLIYILYWIIFYIIFPYIIILFNGSNFGGIFLFAYTLGVAPVVSFFIVPHVILKIFHLRNFFIYSIHILLAIILPFISLLLIFGYIFSHTSFVGF